MEEHINTYNEAVEDTRTTCSNFEICFYIHITFTITVNICMRFCSINNIHGYGKSDMDVETYFKIGTSSPCVLALEEMEEHSIYMFFHFF
jgi:hypothetical protein